MFIIRLFRLVFQCQFTYLLTTYAGTNKTKSQGESEGGNEMQTY